MKSHKFFYIGFTFLSGVFLISAAVIGHMLNSDNNSVFVSAQPEAMCVVIDAGHGGEDGGCVSADGVLEKDINLEVAKKVAELLNSMGYNTVMTRSEDNMLYDMYGDNYEGRKKTYDLKNRLKFTRENEADILVSIHMNKFPQSQYHGLQVYYSDNHADSAELAQSIQSFCRLYLQPDNQREVKKAGSNIFLLDRAEMPAVLVECGFLSNAEETEKLCDNEYRKKLSFMLSMAIVSYLES